ncbi:MAG: hypothetical protein NC417_00065 [Candidatus Gastranaerophilales bacterium]|nr:hypothetical protein [Candidatus Gastranaerophilales bacterium]
MVSSVMAIPQVGKTKREQERILDYRLKEHTHSRSFSQVLETAVDQAVETAPTECQTTTYGRDSQIQNFLYRTREYHY